MAEPNAKPTFSEGVLRMKHVITMCAFTLSIITMVHFIPAQSTMEASKLINTNPDPLGEPWIAGGITFEEWDNSLPEPLQTSLSKTRASSGMPPSKADNSIRPAFRPVFSQKGGSCAQASGIAYQYTYEINVLRNVPSNTAKNQYPYDFTYNFLNGGSGKRGSMSPHGWSIIKAIGVPNVETYGGFGQGNYTRWLSGYDRYYQGMANRLESSFSIKIRTASDILQMKQFLFDHSNGSSTGGILNFAANVKGEKIVALAQGTPEAGKKVVIAFGTTGGHAMTIAGYNDSIRYDYNKDGRYTNNKDINKDGTIDVRDWEIGAVFMVNSWGTRWGNSGKAYLMYKVLADNKNIGGIWSNSLSGIKISHAHVAPQLTYKVRMTYNPRSSIKIKAGYSNNTSASTPSATKTFGRAFYLSGGAFPMQGDNSKTIEIGLDVSDFLPKISSSEAAYFLQIESKSGSGNVEQFSIIDYASGKPVETICQEKNVTVKTGTTRLKIVKSSAPLLVTSPNGGETWERDRTFNITWSTKDTKPVAIELLKDQVLHSTIASAAPSTGTFSWSIPSSITPGNNYAIRIRNTANSSMQDVSDKSFSIENKSHLELTAPNASNYLIKSTTSTISWESTVSGDAHIDVYRHGVFQMNIDNVQISSNAYTWKIPSEIPSGFDYRIRITSKEKDWLYDESDADIGIGYPVVSLPYKETFDNFTQGESLTNNWEQLNDDDINWTMFKGATPSKTHPQGGGTGPNGDHTTGSGMYIYVEASTPNNPGKEAHLLSPVFKTDGLADAHVSFWCHMFSREGRMGELWIDVFGNGQWNDSVLYLTGNHKDSWFKQSIDLAKYKGSQVQLRFRVLTGTDYDSDICIDDFLISGIKTPIKLAQTRRIKQKIALSHNTIRFTGYSGIVRMYTIDGRLVLNKVILSNDEAISIASLSHGMYFLKINNRHMSFIHNGY